jgi:hypothetical protein
MIYSEIIPQRICFAAIDGEGYLRDVVLRRHSFTFLPYTGCALSSSASTLIVMPSAYFEVEVQVALEMTREGESRLTAAYSYLQRPHTSKHSPRCSILLSSDVVLYGTASEMMTRISI